MKELSIFIDESWDFGEIKKLEESTRMARFNMEYIHTGHVI